MATAYQWPNGRPLRIATNLEAALKHEEERVAEHSERPVRDGRDVGGATERSGLPVPPRGLRAPGGSKDFGAQVEAFRMLGGKSKPVLTAVVTAHRTGQQQLQPKHSPRNPYVNKAPVNIPVLSPREASAYWTSTMDSDTGSSSVASSTEGEQTRISISSRAYVSSSVEGHDLYYRPSSRQSFLDFSPTSPSGPEVSNAERTPSVPWSPSSRSSFSSSPSFRSGSGPQPKSTEPTGQMRTDTSRSSAGNMVTATNSLHPSERAELVRRSKKLTHMLGKPPAAEHLQSEQSARRQPPATNAPCHSPPLLPSSHSRPRPTSRRHSTPLTPSHRFDLFRSTGNASRSSFSRSKRMTGRSGANLPSSASFIYLSDEEDDGVNLENLPRQSGGVEDRRELGEEVDPEEERRRMREKIAKLHRFLGSRVPTNLILGFDQGSSDSSLPPIPPRDMGPSQDLPERPQWMRLRRNSSEAILSGWSDEVDRSKEQLDDKEKAMNVRRAHKMEKLFGVAPPQNLYHTRKSSSVALPISGASPKSPTTSTAVRPGPTIKAKMKRPGTPESSQGLLASRERASSLVQSMDSGHDLYTHYQHSLTQLTGIIDRGDTESLAQLDEYLHSNHSPSPTPTPVQEFTRSDRRLSNASVRSERRHSLPASITSTIHEEPLSPQMADFQARRRKAAKLTRFFGEDFMVLLTKVLGSIEQSVEEESSRGTLNPDQATELLHKLRTLRSKP